MFYNIKLFNDQFLIITIHYDQLHLSAFYNRLKLKVALIFQVLVVSNLFFFRSEDWTRIIHKPFTTELIYNTSTDSVFITDCIRIFDFVLLLQSLEDFCGFGCPLFFVGEYSSNPAIPNDCYRVIIPQPCNITSNIMLTTFSVIGE